MLYIYTSCVTHPESMSGCRSAGVDYTDPRSLPGRGVVHFDPKLGLLSSTLIIPLLSDNIIERTEYFGLKFVAISGVDELAVIPVEPTMAIAAINDSNGECLLTSMRLSFAQSASNTYSLYNLYCHTTCGSNLNLLPNPFSPSYVYSLSSIGSGK